MNCNGLNSPERTQKFNFLSKVAMIYIDTPSMLGMISRNYGQEFSNKVLVFSSYQDSFEEGIVCPAPTVRIVTADKLISLDFNELLTDENLALFEGKTFIIVEQYEEKSKNQLTIKKISCYNSEDEVLSSNKLTPRLQEYFDKVSQIKNKLIKFNNQTDEVFNEYTNPLENEIKLIAIKELETPVMTTHSLNTEEDIAAFSKSREKKLISLIFLNLFDGIAIAKRKMSLQPLSKQLFGTLQNEQNYPRNKYSASFSDLVYVMNDLKIDFIIVSLDLEKLLFDSQTIKNITEYYEIGDLTYRLDLSSLELFYLLSRCIHLETSKVIELNNMLIDSIGKFRNNMSKLKFPVASLLLLEQVFPIISNDSINILKNNVKELSKLENSTISISDKILSCDFNFGRHIRLIEPITLLNDNLEKITTFNNEQLSELINTLRVLERKSHMLIDFSFLFGLEELKEMFK